MYDEPRSPSEERSVPVIPPGLLAKTPKAKHRDEFKTFDPKELLKMKEKTLVEWQSQFQKDEPQWMLAQFEWQRRNDRGTSMRGWVAIGISVLSLIVAIIALFRK